jgi:hypothetical protein
MANNKKEDHKSKHSIYAIEKYPDPIRGHYFTQADYEAAIVRIDKKRTKFDNPDTVKYKNYTNKVKRINEEVCEFVDDTDYPDSNNITTIKDYTFKEDYLYWKDLDE